MRAKQMRGFFVIAGLLLSAEAGAHGHGFIVRREWVVRPKPNLVLHPISWMPEKLPPLPSGWKFVGDPTKFLNNEKPAGPPPLESANNVPTPVENPMERGANVVADTHCLWFPLERETAVAAFREGDEIVLVAGGVHELSNVSAENDVTGWKSQVLPHATLIRIAWTASRPAFVYPSTQNGQSGWQVSDNVDAMATVAMDARQKGETIIFDAPAMVGRNQTLQIDDPRSGRRLLIGLTPYRPRLVSTTFHGPGFAVTPSLAGVVVRADADSLELRALPDGFVLDAVGENAVPVRLTPISPALDGENLALTSASPEILRENYRRAWTRAALSAPGARFDARITAARAALALGDAVNADAILQTALRDNPEGIARPGVAFLHRAVAILHGREEELPDEADDNSAEAQLWRGYRGVIERREAPEEKSENARIAALLSAGLPMLRSYPAPLRQAMLPVSSEWIARYGDKMEQERLQNIPQEPAMELAQALANASLHPKEAMPQLERISRDADIVKAARAREAFLRASFIAHSKPPADIADALEMMRPSARIAGREVPVRLLQVQAFIAAHQWESAQRKLQELHHDEPQWSEQLMIADAALDHALMSDDKQANETPQNLAARLIALQSRAENASDIGRREELLQALADCLKSLGMVKRETEVLQKLLPLASQPEKRRALVQRLARDLLQQNNTKAAADLLSENADTSEETAVLQAHVLLAQNDPSSADRVLSAWTGEEASELRADIAERQQDWSKAVSVLKAQPLFHMAPLGGLTFAQQYQVVRLGSDAVRADDRPLVAQLRHDQLSRITAPDLHHLFDMLTRPKVNLAQTAMLEP
ncbi:tetratricopeptide repeat protein [Kozakia baliensis]|uniref:hypothetical protein n=1 Tax=Kozakia baliensis TaxID=153496 RepID=UPI0004982C84|nr:hypothetical protein [Kozakia baliensis]